MRREISLRTKVYISPRRSLISRIFFLEAGENWFTCLWGNGSDFDNVVLRSAYVNSGLKAPWLYGNNRCYRTICSWAPDITPVRKGTHHNALDDARSQAEHLIAIYASMKNVE